MEELKPDFIEVAGQSLDSVQNPHKKNSHLRRKLGGALLAASITLGSAGCAPKPEPTEPGYSFPISSALEQTFNVEKGQLIDVNPGDIISGGNFDIAKRGISRDVIINSMVNYDVVKLGGYQGLNPNPWVVEMQVPGEVYTDTGTQVKQGLNQEDAKQFIEQRINELKTNGGAQTVNVVKYNGIDFNKPFAWNLEFQADHNFDNARSLEDKIYYTQREPWQSIEPQIVWDGKLEIGQPKNLLLLGDYLPNGHITSFRGKYFYPESNKTMKIDPTEGGTLVHLGEFGGYTGEPVLKPDKNKAFMQDSAELTSILQLDKNDPRHLIGLGQFEQWKTTTDANGMSMSDGSTFTATVGKAESFDGGNSWKNVEPIISGDDFIAPGEHISGAGQPAAYYNEKDGYVYIMYIDWSSQKNIQHPDQLYLSRAKANEDGTIGTIEYLHKDGTFNENMNPNELKPVVPPPPDNIFSAQPSISFNTVLSKYLCIFQTDKGFYATTSDDLINWDTNSSEIVNFEKIGIAPNSGKYIGNPTLLSDETYANDKTTGASGTLYFSYSPDIANIPPNLGGVEFNFKQQ